MGSKSSKPSNNDNQSESGQSELNDINYKMTGRNVPNIIQLYSPDDIALRELDVSSVPNVILQNKSIRARVIDVYDGDTITVIFMLGDVPVKYKIRLIGIDTPEIRSGKGKLAIEKDAAIKCQKFLSCIIHEQIVTLKIIDWDKYGGRLLGNVYTNINNNISNLLINLGYARPYDGGTKQPWTKEELIKILNIN